MAVGDGSTSLPAGHNLALAGSFHYYATDSDRFLQYGGTLAANWGFPWGTFLSDG